MLEKRDSNILTKYPFIFKYLMMVGAVVIITMVLPKQPKFKYEFEKGNIWLHEDLVSPYNYPLKKSIDEVNADRQSIKKSVLPIYHINEKVKEAQLAQFQADFEAKWSNAKIDNPLIKAQTFNQDRKSVV